MSKKNNDSFAQLGRDIHQAVRDALREVDVNEIKETIEKSLPQKRKGGGLSEEAETGKKQLSWLERNQGRPPSPYVSGLDAYGNPIAPMRRKAAMLKGVGYFVGVPMLFASLASTIGVLDSMAYASAATLAVHSLANLLFLYPITFFALRAGWIGTKMARARKRFGAYWSQLKERGFATIAQLARVGDGSPYSTRKEIRFMVEQGMFDRALFDREHDMLVINEPKFRAYEKALELEDGEPKRPLQEPQENHVQPEAEPARNVQEEGRLVLSELRTIRQSIQTPEMSAKLAKIERITQNIFEVIANNPDKEARIRRFLQYYLPTTVKLVKTYDMLEDQPVQGPNIAGSKARIEESMALIEKAFETLLDELFQKDSLDIQSDIIAMETMMSRDGLGGRDFIRPAMGEETEEDNGR